MNFVRGQIAKTYFNINNMLNKILNGISTNTQSMHKITLLVQRFIFFIDVKEIRVMPERTLQSLETQTRKTSDKQNKQAKEKHTTQHGNIDPNNKLWMFTCAQWTIQRLDVHMCSMDNLETQAILSTKHRTKTKEIQHRNKKDLRLEPTKGKNHTF